MKDRELPSLDNEKKEPIAKKFELEGMTSVFQNLIEGDIVVIPGENKLDAFSVLSDRPGGGQVIGSNRSKDVRCIKGLEDLYGDVCKITENNQDGLLIKDGKGGLVDHPGVIKIFGQSEQNLGSINTGELRIDQCVKVETDFGKIYFFVTGKNKEGAPIVKAVMPQKGDLNGEFGAVHSNKMEPGKEFKFGPSDRVHSLIINRIESLQTMPDFLIAAEMKTLDINNSSFEKRFRRYLKIISDRGLTVLLGDLQKLDSAGNSGENNKIIQEKIGIIEKELTERKEKTDEAPFIQLAELFPKLMIEIGEPGKENISHVKDISSVSEAYFRKGDILTLKGNEGALYELEFSMYEGGVAVFYPDKTKIKGDFYGVHIGKKEGRLVLYKYDYVNGNIVKNKEVEGIQELQGMEVPLQAVLKRDFINKLESSQKNMDSKIKIGSEYITPQVGNVIALRDKSGFHFFEVVEYKESRGRQIECLQSPQFKSRKKDGMEVLTGECGYFNEIKIGQPVIFGDGKRTEYMEEDKEAAYATGIILEIRYLSREQYAMWEQKRKESLRTPERIADMLQNLGIFISLGYKGKNIQSMAALGDELIKNFNEIGLEEFKNMFIKGRSSKNEEHYLTAMKEIKDKLEKIKKN